MENQKLSPLHYASLHHAEFAQFIIRFYEDFTKTSLNAATDSDFKLMFDALQAQIPNYNAALEQIRASEESVKIADADRVRDADFQALKDSVKPFRNAKTQEEKDAYNAVKIVLDQFKDVQDNSYEEETNRLNTLLTKLQSADISGAVAVLGITKFINHLADSNTAFNNLFAHRSFQTSQKVSYDVKALRQKLTNDYRKMANYITTLAGIKTDPFYADTLSVLNNSRKYFSDVLAKRKPNAKPPVKPNV